MPPHALTPVAGPMATPAPTIDHALGELQIGARRLAASSLAQRIQVIQQCIAAVSEVGYVELPEDQLEATRTTWKDRTTGTTEGDA